MPKPYTKIQSVERAVQILDALSRSHEAGLTLGQVAKEVNINSSTAHHLLGTLVNSQLVEQEQATRHYRLGIHLIELGNAALSSTGLARVARPFLEKLWQSTGKSITLLLFHGVMRTAILSTTSREILSVRPAPLELTTLHATGSGKLALAFLPEQELKEFLQHARLTRFTSATITDRDALIDELVRIRQDGYALDNEEHGENVRCISTAIRDAGYHVVGCFDLVFPVYDVSEEQLQEWVKASLECAQELAQQLKSIGLTVH
jgi:IclR family transcriptional regulator, KDG regulon repressor